MTISMLLLHKRFGDEDLSATLTSINCKQKSVVLALLCWIFYTMSRQSSPTRENKLIQLAAEIADTRDRRVPILLLRLKGE